MIVTILSSSATFNGVSYNTDKVDTGKGELMQVTGFGPLEALGILRPEDYKNHLLAVSAQNKRVSEPQFHAVISAEGRSYDKYALTEIANQWLDKMGYGHQPFLIVYHKDTDNNHVHIVSTRVDKKGRRINRDFENTRAIQNLNRVMGIDEKHSTAQDIKNALAYVYSTKAQFMMVLEAQGYTLKQVGDKIVVMKFGMKQTDIDVSLVEKHLSQSKPNVARTRQLTAIFQKYARAYDTTLKPNSTALPGGYSKVAKGFSSEFSIALKEKLGLVLVFHASGDKGPYGYSIIDRATNTVFKGSEVLSLKELLNQTSGKQYFREKDPIVEQKEDALFYYAAILKAALYNYPDLVQGLHHQGLSITRSGKDFILKDQGTRESFYASELLDEKDFKYLMESFSQFIHIPGVSIAADVDDEAVYGRKRRRKSRTNTR